MTTVLVLENEPAIRTVLEELFRDAGLQVMAAASAPEALAVMAAGLSVDAMVVDLMLGAMSGVEFLKAVRAMPHGDHIPAVVTTGAAETPDLCPALYQALVLKPYRVSELAKIVTRLASGAAGTKPSVPA